MRGEPVEFEHVEGMIETTDALQCLIDGRLVWIPKSQIDDSSEVCGEGRAGTLIISERIAVKKGLV